jgi:PAS domain S-box-containing protein
MVLGYGPNPSLSLNSRPFYFSPMDAVAMKDIKHPARTRHAARRLVAIIESSEDAILAKDLNGIITDWNEGARRLFGYTAEEAIGRSVTMLIPEDRHDEEPAILARIRRGERIEHYETIRQHKDGSPIDISLTVSPILNRKGEVIGASKIARDISDKRRAEQQKDLLLREMNHRIKNLFAISSSLVSLSAKHAKSIEDLIADLQGRFSALASAHSLTLATDASQRQDISLHSLIQKVMTPYHNKERPDPQVTISGPDWTITGSEVTYFALLFYEFATNAAKHGALSTPIGRIVIECSEDGDQMTLIWREHGVNQPTADAHETGFGSVLIRATVESLNGKFEQSTGDQSLELRITFPRK